MLSNDDRALFNAMKEACLLAGERILAIYQSEFVVDAKSDQSPVTEADRAGEAIIVERLRAAAPTIPILAEEEASSGSTPFLGAEFFLVDPLDGTREFISRNGEFTVNVALVRDGEPVLGIVFAPALGKLYGGAIGDGAFLESVSPATKILGRRAIKVRTPDASGLVAVASRSHRGPETDAFLETLKIADFAAAGSSLKFCLIAEGSADVYPRLGRTMEWDTAAGQAVLEAAGGSVVVYETNAPLRYGKSERGYDNPYFVAWGRRSAA